jgi:hypothetical protein
MISGMVNYAFEKQSVLGTIKWVLEADDRIISQEDFALGYVVGSLMNIADSVASRRKLSEKLEKRYKKSLEKIYGKEDAEVELRKSAMWLEKTKAKGGRRIKSELTEEETDDIRSMLVPMIQRFREKIRKELALKKV